MQPCFFLNHQPVLPPGYDPRWRPWYQTALRQSGFAVSPPYCFASIAAIGITCVLPVRDDAGNLLGVLGMDILLDSMTTILEGLEIPKDGRAFVLDSTGQVVASQFRLAEDVARGLWPAGLKDGGPDPTVPRGWFSATLDGRHTYFVYRRTADLGWIIAVGMPCATILAPSSRLLRIVAGLDLALMLALLLAVAAISGRLIVQPLDYIVSVINRKEGGQRDARAIIRSADEFGFLGGELNKLFDTVDGHAADLESKVKQRSEELILLQQENTRFRIAEERKRIYRDMHDSIGAKLTNIFFSNGVARDMAKGEPAPLVGMLNSIETNCLAAVQSLKGLVLGMKEDDRIAADSAKFLSVGIRQRLRTGGIAFDCRITGRAELNACPEAIRSELEKVFEELVSNVLKHSSAARVRLRAKADPSSLSFSFADDGVGMTLPNPGDTVSGLNNIQYRIKHLGGSMRIDSRPGFGTSFRITIPLVDGSHEA